MSSLRHTARHSRRIWASLSNQQLPMTRFFSAPPAEEEELSFQSPKVEDLYGRIKTLPQEEVNVLGALVIQVLGVKIFPGQFGGGGAAGGTEATAAVEEVQEEKTIFDLKLVGFDAKAKIKVIKEVRSIAGLGLKEAKDLVESAPKVIQKDLKPEKAEELKAALEAVGAQVEVV
ncbi:MAG: hypothetical protein SGBAC_001464 [Bacillariaceae sp.]